MVLFSQVFATSSMRMDDLDNSGCDDLNKMELLSSVTIFVAFSFRFKTEDDNTGQAE